MPGSVAIDFIKDKKGHKGTLYLRTFENGKSVRASLPIKLSKTDYKTYFNKGSNQFRKNARFPQYETFNDSIAQKIKELNRFENSIKSFSGDKKCFIEYSESIISTITNHGTKIKTELVVAKLKKFLLFIHKPDPPDLLFKEITPTFLRQFKAYMITKPDPKRLSNNSANHYLKMIHGLIRKAAKDDTYTFSKDPFNSLEFIHKPADKGVLSEDEIYKLIATKIKDDRISGARDMFLFQLFANGMRVSDVILLRWNNFKGSRLDYKMFKTKHNIDIPFNVSICQILSKILGVENRLDNIENTYKIPYVDLFGVENKQTTHTTVSLNQLEEEIKKHKLSIPEKYSEAEEKFQANLLTGKIEEYKGYFIKKDKLPFMVRLINHRERCKETVEFEFLDLTKNRIKRTRINVGRGNEFVFPYLSNSEFNNIQGNNFDDVTIDQYKAMKHASIVYNRHLKEVMKACNIDTNISSHVSRHSFTSILIKDSLNTYDISLSLGHSGLKVTENYIKKGFKTDKVDYIGKGISDKFRNRG